MKLRSIDLFSLYVLFFHFRPRDAPNGKLPFVFVINCAYICTCIRRHLKETISSRSITWSEMAKQNIQAKEVYCVNFKPIKTKRLTFVFDTGPNPPIQLSYWKATRAIKFRSQRSQSYSCKTMQLVQAAAPLIKGSLIGWKIGAKRIFQPLTESYSAKTDPWSELPLRISVRLYCCEGGCKFLFYLNIGVMPSESSSWTLI